MDDSEEEEDMEEGDEDEDVLSLPFLGIPYFPYPCAFKVPVRLLSQSLYVLSIATISHVPDDASFAFAICDKTDLSRWRNKMVRSRARAITRVF